MTVQERESGHEQQRTRFADKLGALGSVAAIGALVGGGWLGLHELNSHPTCGETLELGNGTPRGYIDLGGSTYGVETSSTLGETALTIREGSVYQELQKHPPTTIHLLDQKDGSQSGELRMAASDMSVRFTIDKADENLQIACKSS
jgi:hypothetical protein